MPKQDLVDQFRSLSTVNKVGISLAAFNAIGIVLVLAQLGSIAGVKADLQSAISNSTEQFTNAIDQAVISLNANMTTLNCSGTYTGKINIDFPDIPSKYYFSGDLWGGRITGTMEKNKWDLSFPSRTPDGESGTIALSCE